MGGEWLSLVADRLPELWLRTGEHMMLTGISTGLAILVGVPLGIVASGSVRLRGPVLGTIGVLQTVPSLAMLAMLLALLNRIGALPAIIALTLYALLPVVRNTLTGLEGVSSDVMEAARGIGMTQRQRLWLVKLPLALPVIVAGIRTAAVVGVGIATLSAFIGAGGLGQFINRGLALSNMRLILLGAIPAAFLALLVDYAIAATQWGLQPTRQADKGTLRARLKPAGVALPLLVLTLGFFAWVARPAPGSAVAGAETIRVGAKNFTEQIILGEIIAQMIEGHTDLRVERRFNLGGTMVCHGALTSGEIDLYAEYTGTGLTAVLEHEAIADPDEAWRVVTRAYRRLFDVEWLRPFGFNNTYALTVRRGDAVARGWETISDLASEAPYLRAGFTGEFAERPDGYPGLATAYDYRFGETLDLDPALMYEAVARKQVDVICAFATDGRIAAFDLKPLADDRGFFPPYQAAPVVRGAILRAHPEIRDALDPLAGELDNVTMQNLNYDVDQNKRRPMEVAREFLITQDLLGKD